MTRTLFFGVVLVAVAGCNERRSADRIGTGGGPQGRMMGSGGGLATGDGTAATGGETGLAPGYTPDVEDLLDGGVVDGGNLDAGIYTYETVDGGTVRTESGVDMLDAGR